jgi:bacteriocin-like protein
MKKLDDQQLSQVTGGNPAIIAAALGAVGGLFSGGINTAVNTQGNVNQGSGKQINK